MNAPMKIFLAKALGIDEETKDVLDYGSDHDYKCHCSTCRKWWQNMGPDGIAYGPFTIEEIEDDSKLGQVCKAMRLENLKQGNF